MEQKVKEAIELWRAEVLTYTQRSKKQAIGPIEYHWLGGNKVAIFRGKFIIYLADHSIISRIAKDVRMRYGRYRDEDHINLPEYDMISDAYSWEGKGDTQGLRIRITYYDEYTFAEIEWLTTTDVMNEALRVLSH